MQRETFLCLGDSYPKASTEGRESHLVHNRVSWYHNVYAGPFCRYHQVVFQNHAIAENNLNKGYVQYELKPLPKRLLQDK